MRITEQTRYALLVMAACAEDWPRHLTAKMLAERTGLTEFTIFKLLKVATRSGLLESVRGRNGGVRLAGEPRSITVGSVMRAFEPRFRSCGPAERLLPDAKRTPVEDRLDQALGSGFGAFLSALDTITISDLAGEHPAGAMMPPIDRPAGLMPRSR